MNAIHALSQLSYGPVLITAQRAGISACHGRGERGVIQSADDLCFNLKTKRRRGRESGRPVRNSATGAFDIWLNPGLRCALNAEESSTPAGLPRRGSRPRSQLSGTVYLPSPVHVIKLRQLIEVRAQLYP